METTNLKVGERVAFATCNVWKPWAIHFDTIKKITASGRITLSESGRIYNKFGLELRSEKVNEPRGQLIETDKANEIIHRNDKNRADQELKNQLEKAIGFDPKHRPYTAEQIEAINALISAFAKPTE